MIYYMIGDGKMNNDQGFNGRKPLFDNEFNGPYGAANNFTGPGISGAPQYGPVGQPNNGYQPFTMGFNQPGQPASPYGNQYDQQPSDFSRSQTDLPPELGEIKNLNEAAVSSAPTMDVLGPMNVMPQNPTFPQDPLDAYEQNGFNNYANAGYNHSPVNLFNANPYGGMPNNGPLPSNGYASNPGMMNDIPPQTPDFSYNQPPNFNVGMNSDQNFNQGMAPGTETNYNSNINMPDPLPQFQSNYPEPSFNLPTDNDYSGANILSKDLSDKSNTSYFNRSTDSSLPNLDNLPPMSSDILNTSLTNDYNLTPHQPDTSIPLGSNVGLNEDNGFLPSKSEVSLPDEYSSVLPASFDNYEPHNVTDEDEVMEDNEIKKPMDKPYEILNYSLTTADDNDELDMRLDESYDEPDSLEIMDVDLDEDDKSESLSSFNDEVLSNVKKIKDLVSDIKASGQNVETEEFDYENVYEIIVKFNK